MIKVNLFSIHFYMANLLVSTKKVNFFTRQIFFFLISIQLPHYRFVPLSIPRYRFNPFFYYQSLFVINPPPLLSIYPVLTINLLSPSLLLIHPSSHYQSTSSLLLIYSFLFAINPSSSPSSIKSQSTLFPVSVQ
jgi:hypothetical protein